MQHDARSYTLDWLLDRLVDGGLLSPEQAGDLRRRQTVLKTRLLRRKLGGLQARRNARYDVSPAEVIVEANVQMPDGSVLTEDKIMQEVARASGHAYVKIDPLKLDEKLVTETMSRPFARHHVCIPLRRRPDGSVVFAVDNPFDIRLRESLSRLAPAGVDFEIAAKTDILKVITDIYGFRKAISAAHQDLDTGVDLGNLEQFVRLKSVDEIEANDKHVVNAVEYLLHYALDQRASDIHVEPKRDESNIRFRIDGILHTIHRMPRIVHNAVVSRVKTMARMDIAERRRPQDGRIKTERDGVEVELRVSSLPVAFGEKLVIRIFDPQTLLQDIEHLGFTHSELASYQGLLGSSTGMVLVTGPTGSGKTTTIYSTLRLLAGPDVNITTVEDPIEMVYEPFNQVLVQRKIELGFAEALRTILRQDPDIIMVGEIRDDETAQMAIQAALTGHLVFSTLHTNDAPSTITRMQDLGVPNFLLSSTLLGVMAQRLIRKNCTHCKVESELTLEQATMLGIELPPGSDERLPVWYGEGCDHCRGTGLFGRTGVFEVMPIDLNLQSLILNGADAETLRREARANGMTTLREAAIRKLALGVTAFEEVVRVVGE